MKLMFGMNVGGILIKAISSVSFHPDRPLLTYPHASSTTPPPPAPVLWRPVRQTLVTL